MNNNMIVSQRFMGGVPFEWRGDSLAEKTSAQKGMATGKPWSLADYPSLFLTFAALTPTNKDEILSFAERYGRLGDDWDYSSLHAWQRQIEAMRGAIKLWEAWKHRDRKSLAQMIWWGHKDGQDVIRYRTGDAFGVWGSSEHTDMPLGPDEVNGVRKGDLETAGMLVLQKLIGLGLGEIVIDLRPIDGHLRLSFLPLNLAGALWLQFALAVVGDYDYRSCEHCGKPFLVGPDANRTHRRYCKDSCKTMASRKRRKEPKANLISSSGTKRRLPTVSSLLSRSHGSPLKKWRKGKNGTGKQSRLL